MKRKFLKVFLALMCIFVIGMCLVSCNLGSGSESTKFYLQSGEEAPTSLDVEMGALCIIPKVVDKDGLELEYVVKANDGSSVEINNGKFRSGVLSGYKIEYSFEDEIFTIAVNVSDTEAPVIIVNAPDGMTVIYNTTVTIPACKVSDASSNELVAEISVADKDGNPVTVTENTFGASVLGTYAVTYKATDASGNVGTKTLNINCEQADLLNGFETLNDVGYFADPHTKEINTEYASTGNAVKVTDTGTDNYTYRTLYVPLKLNGEMITVRQLLKYEKVQLTVYASESNELGLANGTFGITAGQNILVFTREQIQAGIKFAKAQFSEADGFLLNLRYGTEGFWLVLDDFIGIYPRDYVPTVERDITINGVENMPILMGSEVTLPEAMADDGNGVPLEYKVTVKDKTGTEVTVDDNKFIAEVVGPYTAEYEITSAGYEGYATIGFVCRYGTLLNDFETTSSVTYASEQASTDSAEVITGYDGNAVKIVAAADFSWSQVRLPVQDAKGYVTAENFAKYDKLVFVIYVQSSVYVCTANNNEGYTLNAGWNIVSFSISNYVAAGNFAEDANGIYLCVNSLAKGSAIVFDSIFGLYTENYQPPVEGNIVINTVQGKVISYNTLTAIPTATILDADGNPLEYTVTVKDKDGNPVAVSENTFVPTVLGAYELTYTITAQGYEGSERINLQCKKAKLINSFDELLDLPYVVNNDVTKLIEIVNALDGNGAKTTAPNGLSWAQVRLGAKDKGEYMTWADFQKFAKVQIVVYSSASATFGTATFSESVGVVEGWNIVELSMSAIVSAGNFREDANGFYLCVNGLGENEYLIFDSFYGIYADDYEPAKEATVQIDSINGLYAMLGKDYAIPSYTATDGQTPLQCDIAVTDKSGNAVTVSEGKFLAEVLGTYTITYKVSTEGYEGEASVTVECKKGNILNNFDKDGDMTYIQPAHTTTVVDALSGKGLKTVADAAFSWSRVSFPMTEGGAYLTAKNLAIYNKIAFVIYAETSIYVCTANNNEGYTLNAGWNIVEFSPANIIAAAGFEENANGYYMCVNGLAEGKYFTLFAAYGIYADDYEPPVAGALTVNSIDGLIAMLGKEYVLPTYTAVDGDGEPLAVEITLTDKDGNPVSVTENKFTPTALGTYTATYKITSQGYTGEQSVTIVCKKGNVLNSFDKADDMTYVGAGNTQEVTNALSGSGIKITATADFSWSRVSFPMKENGDYLTLTNLGNYDKIRFVIYCSSSVYVCTANNNESYTLNAGWNIVEFSPANIIAAGGFEENANGYYMCVNSLAKGEHIILYSAEGIYADSYEA